MADISSNKELTDLFKTDQKKSKICFKYMK